MCKKHWKKNKITWFDDLLAQNVYSMELFTPVLWSFSLCKAEVKIS